MTDLIAQAEAWQHLKQFGYAPGNYMRECCVCKTVVGDLDKRAITCRPCAEKAFAAAEQPAEAVARYLCEATRFKMSFDDEGKVNCFAHFANELDQRWVALVAAENDSHMIPDPRIAQLDGLLRRSQLAVRVLHTMLDVSLTRSVGVEVAKELDADIEAALGGK